ncbi:hypothetical protein L9F63_012025, partial [Diploptera punctata]
RSTKQGMRLSHLGRHCASERTYHNLAMKDRWGKPMKQTINRCKLIAGHEEYLCHASGTLAIVTICQLRMIISGFTIGTNTPAQRLNE